MPVGYLVSVALVALGTLFALAPPRSLGNLSFRLGLLLNEVPIAGFYWLLASTSLAFGQGDIDSPGGWATVGLAALTTAGLAVVAWRGLQASPALDRAMSRGPRCRLAQQPSTPSWPHGCAAAFRSPASCSCRSSCRRRDVERVANISYGDAGRRNLLDLYRHRARPSGGPVLIHLHGGGYSQRPEEPPSASPSSTGSRARAGYASARTTA